jgi:hypothetical protein
MAPFLVAPNSFGSVLSNRMTLPNLFQLPQQSSSGLDAITSTVLSVTRDLHCLRTLKK